MGAWVESYLRHEVASMLTQAVMAAALLMAHQDFPELELRDAKTGWRGNEGDAGDMPIFTVVVRNRSSSECLQSVTGKVSFRDVRGKPVYEYEGELLLMSIHQHVLNMGIEQVVQVPVVLAPKDAVTFRLAFYVPLPTVVPAKTAITILHVDKRPAGACRVEDRQRP